MKKTRHIITISGKDSLATALFLEQHKPNIDFEYVFNDTFAELPETYDWLDKIEKTKNWKIIKIGESLEGIIKKYNFLPSVQKRFCTAQAKIKPFDRFFKSDVETHIYYGLRADEQRIKRVPYDNMIPHYPLMDNGINLGLVLQICESQGLKPPTFFWETLFEETEKVLKNQNPLFMPSSKSWQSHLTPLEFDYLFSGRSRSNCFFCFFQRQYEWVWLSETHPDLFEKAVELENKHGKKGYTWVHGYQLIHLIQRKDAVINKRAKQIAKHIENKVNNTLFNSNISIDSEISFTSCGLLCGK